MKLARTRCATRGRQAGFSGALLIIAIILIGVAVLLARGLSRTDVSLEREAGTRANLARVTDALMNFAMMNARLPCPARGDDDGGDAAPPGATPTCTNGDGVVPWRTLGLRREDALDGWRRKISYRVFTGPSGLPTGLTQAGGANATDCSTNAGAPAPPPDGTMAANGLCNAIHGNSYGQFLAGKGFTVVDQGANKTGIAFVLISHGDSGYGAYAAEGPGRSVLPAAGGNESSNTGATSPFYSNPRSAQGIQPADINHFDDVVLYKTIDELAAGSKLVARPWPLP